MARGIRLIASMIVRNERTRYLGPCLDSLLSFCDEVRVLDDGSTDGSYEMLLERQGVSVLTNAGPTFFEHEGKARQALLEWTLEGSPTHILAIDADEFVASGSQLRKLAIAGRNLIWTLPMQEIWEADEEGLWIRQDGGWREHPVPHFFAVPPARTSDWRILERELACGREPLAIRRRAGRARRAGTEILHFGWTNHSERQRRYDRYARHDAGRFHANAHLESILWPDEKVKVTPRPWPAELDAGAILFKARKERP
jgi:glycosyltransferase involved in cell wall biosynthesis